MSDNDQLCVDCATVPLYALFTGPRREYYTYDEGVEHGSMGTLHHVWTNINCPLCRMAKHCLIVTRPDIFERISEICDARDIRVELWPTHANALDEMVFIKYETRKLVASRLVVQLKALPHVTKEVSRKLEVNIHSTLPGIYLLSPDSVDPARPLQNGFLAPSMDDSLRLLRTWIDECEGHHHATCHAIGTMPSSRVLPAHIRAIDVRNSALVEIDPAISQYATLSYVWGDSTASYTAMAASLAASSTPRLPATVPQLILDAISVCSSLAIPYLWVDLYCINQTDPAIKATEITLMGQIYRFSTITLVAGSSTHRALLPTPAMPSSQQLTFTTASKPAGRKLTLVTRGPLLREQLAKSPWTTRSWTFQEGHLARRIAFFDPPHPLSFVCGSGIFSPTLHSGPYGHSPRPPLVDLRSMGFHLLSGHQFLVTPVWRFDEFERIIDDYARRELSFESDKLIALEGFLDAIAERKGLEFLWGTPTAGFHYGLLWGGMDGERRPGFPSWTWAGWMSSPRSIDFLVRPVWDGKALMKQGDGGWECTGGEGELQVVWPRGGTWCRERLAGVRLRGPGYETVRIESEVVKLWLGFGLASGEGCMCSCSKVLRGGGVEALEDDRMYRFMFGQCGFYFRDGSGNLFHDDSDSIDRRMSRDTRVWLPETLSGKALRWLMLNGLELVRVLDLEELEVPDGLAPRRQVLCLGVDRTWDEGLAGRGCRMGMLSLPWHIWERAGPEKMVVELW
ncbi:heterokaryon incompatibility protein-domain-containing protein [Podospora conica]|nr:heterokaryon incompatibility protein-domain-containing protein [Schizothecium conicum]